MAASFWENEGNPETPSLWDRPYDEVRAREATIASSQLRYSPSRRHRGVFLPSCADFKAAGVDHESAFRKRPWEQENMNRPEQGRRTWKVNSASVVERHCQTHSALNQRKGKKKPTRVEDSKELRAAIISQNFCIRRSLFILLCKEWISRSL